MLELFHLEFLRNLRPRRGKFEYVLKGGTNLRFFHSSVRYSQDADLDIVVGLPDVVRAEVARALGAAPLGRTLAAHGIEILDHTISKQTNTTQRWKFRLDIQLGTPSSGRLSVPTRIEFSAREELLDYLDEAREDFVADAVVQPHHIIAPLIPHYLATPATVQKVRSLAERQHVQSRDVFDLEMLFRTNPTIDLAGRIDQGKVRDAAARTAEISFEEYRSQVVAFLEEGYAELYGDPQQWQQVQLRVMRALEGLLS